MRYFDSVKSNIQDYSLNRIKPLKICIKTIQLLKTEKERDNEYIKVAKNFVKYENGIEEDSGDWYFYKYLKSLGYDDKYIFPLKDGGKVVTQVYLFKPFDSNLHNLINPQWHLLVSYYAYIDVAFNHMDNIYAQKIAKKNGWKPNKPIIKKFDNRNKVLCTWMNETKQ